MHGLIYVKSSLKGYNLFLIQIMTFTTKEDKQF